VLRRRLERRLSWEIAEELGEPLWRVWWLEEAEVRRMQRIKGQPVTWQGNHASPS